MPMLAYKYDRSKFETTPYERPTGSKKVQRNLNSWWTNDDFE